MHIQYILLIKDVNQFNEKVRLFIFNVFDIRRQMTAKIFSSLFIVQFNISCDILIYHAIFPRILISLNHSVLNRNNIFKILHISLDLHNDSKQIFLFASIYFMRDIHRKKIQNNCFKSLGMQFPLLMYMKTVFGM